jgi:agmatine deiminase
MATNHESRITNDAAFRMPAEWAPQERIWLSWPHARGDWPGKFAPVPWVFAEMVRVITGSGQRVGLLVKDAAARSEAMDYLDRAGATLTLVDILEIKTNRGWLRDCGPIWAKDAQGALVALDWKFNGWAKYANHKLDNAVPPHITAFTKHQTITPMHKGKPVVLEGGGIEVDGAGTVIVTEEWLLSDTQIRNKGFTREDYEQVFATYLGATNTIWLEAGIVGDDTHGHVDDITRFVDERTIVTAIESDTNDANYDRLHENKRRLQKARDQNGKAFEVIDIPMPRPVLFEGQRLPASYANFLICNKVVLVPVFNDAADATALKTLEACFPKRQVVPIYARDLVWGLGTIHCLSQQQPA